MRIFAIAHDTGGAQLVAALLKAEAQQFHWLPGVFHSSPAERIFARLPELSHSLLYLDNEPVVALLENTRPDVLLTATSGTKMELPFIRAARELGIPSVSLLDHWINYRERFDYPAPDWTNNIPDVVAVGDAVALDIARELGFPRVLPLKNYYLIDMLQRYRDLPPASDDNTSLLLLSQVVPFDPQRTTGVQQAVVAPYEWQILHDILVNFDKLARFLDIEKVVVRKHPAMHGLLYHDLAERFPNVPLEIESPTSKELGASLRTAKLVLGRSSMALFTATALGKETYSFATDDDTDELPPVGRSILRSVRDIFTGTAILSPFRHDCIFMNDEHNFSSFLGQMLS
jgi:hypothetical protein